MPEHEHLQDRPRLADRDERRQPQLFAVHRRWPRRGRNRASAKSAPASDIRARSDQGEPNRLPAVAPAEDRVEILWSPASAALCKARSYAPPDNRPPAPRWCSRPDCVVHVGHDEQIELQSRTEGKAGRPEPDARGLGQQEPQARRQRQVAVGPLEDQPAAIDENLGAAQKSGAFRVLRRPLEIGRFRVFPLLERPALTRLSTACTCSTVRGENASSGIIKVGSDSFASQVGSIFAASKNGSRIQPS